MIVTDPPYYDAIPYSDLMDFFYVWLRRTLHGLSPEIDAAFVNHLHRNGITSITMANWWTTRADMMETARSRRQSTKMACIVHFSLPSSSLTPDGRFVIVFAHKQPDAWETLVSAIIRAGFVVDGSLAHPDREG